MMNEQVTYFCEIIKNVIHPDEEFRLNEEVDWTYLVRIAKEHNLLPIFMEGAIKQYSYISRSEYDKEMGEAIACVATQIKRTNAFLKLYNSFIQGGIHPIVMKGLICRQLYNELADHRPSGDEDILIRSADYWRAKKILLDNGYVSEFDNETESQLEQLQEVSFIHPTDKLHIELHLNPMGRENKTRSSMSDCFEMVHDDYKEVEIEGVMVRTMNHQDHLLYLIFHAFRHFTSGGVGMRQMLDILLYQERYGSEIDLNLIYQILHSFKADTFHADLVYIGNTCLGFDLPVMKECNCPLELLDDMVCSGTFGNKTQAERTAVATTMAATEYYGKKQSSNIIVLIWKSVFPSLAMMQERYPYLTDKPWLLPVEWIKRWGRFFKYNRNNSGNLAMESMKISQRRMKLMKKYDLV